MAADHGLASLVLNATAEHVTFAGMATILNRACTDKFLLAQQT